MKALIFDVDDTLYDQLLPFQQALQKRLAIADEDIFPLYLTFRHYADQLFLEVERGELSLADSHLLRMRQALLDWGYRLSDQDIQAIQKDYASLQGKLFLDPMFPRIFQSCQENGLMLGIITNGPYSHQLEKIECLGLQEWIDPHRILISGQLGIAKPDREIFRIMEERLGVGPVDILYVGDSYENDVVGAKRAGWQSLWFNHRKRSSLEGAYQADYIIERWNQLEETITRLVRD